MNKKGITILELLISISMISVIILLLLKVMISLEDINNDKSYASSDEIQRTEIIKEIENEFLSNKLNGLSINGRSITFTYEDNSTRTLKIEDNKLTFKDTYILKSNNATYDKCINYKYQDLDNNYYLINITIPVLIDNKNTTINDDINLTYLGLKKDNTNYPINFTCS